MVLDLVPYKHSLVNRDDLHEIHQSLKTIQDVMKSLTQARRLRVSMITQGRRERHLALLESRRQERQTAADG